ncbi:nucleoside-diphosphate-sugar epimerase-like protein [Roridomyces roridus]|uniref:Nucleoside-diphosphate-sugar epimerase-like protein n=1 Tax=Roridomyces roridus TaxID=1738132 RepID=A0AAD7FCR0_9AGAR|nr:nucleoside-diphosphate-sugar epimerase-like protein [Roridomyces roridus]
MKLVIGGSSGFVGVEIVRQALLDPAFMSVVALSRRETALPAGAGAEKFTSVVCHDFLAYPESVQKVVEGADACIWMKTVSFEENTKISRDYAVHAIQALATRARPLLRFIYITGHATARTLSEIPEMLKAMGNQDWIDYSLMRGDAESKILAFAGQSNGAVEACVVRPGLIQAPEREVRNVPGVPNVERVYFVAAMLDQVKNGFDEDTLRNDDLVRIGQRVWVG